MIKIFDYFLKNYRLYYQIGNIDINYGTNAEAKILIAKSIEDSFWDKMQDIDIKDVVWKEWKGVKIPYCFDKENDKDILTIDNGSIIINYDIVASTFYFLSGWNEYVNSKKDEFGRVAYKNSIIAQLKIGSIPVVNYYFDILNDAISKIYGKREKALWDNRDFAVALTHDIDACKRAWLEGSYSELKKKHFLSIPKLIFKRFFLKDDWFNFKMISDLEKEFNATSSFYFLPRKGKINKWKNADYNIKDKDIRKAIKMLKDSGHEIGVHGSFGTHISAEELKTDIDRLNSNVIGNRFHFLMFDLKKTVDVLEKCDIKYDTTLGFAEQVGFRRGTCYPFYLYDFLNGNCSDVLEIPLITMDASLQNAKYMGLTPEEAFAPVKQLIDEIIKFKGVFTILWHNTFFSAYKYTGWKDVYIEILEYCRKKNGLLTNGETIYNSIIKK